MVVDDGALAGSSSDYTINQIVDAVITDPLQRRNNKKLENAVYERFLATGSKETIKYYETELAKLQKARSEQGWFGKLGLGTRNDLDNIRQGRFQYALQYARTITENRDVSEIFENFKSNNKAEKKKTSNWFSNLFGGGKKQEEEAIKKTEKKKSGNWFSNLFGGKKQETPKKQEKKKEKKTNWWSGLFSKKKPEKEKKKNYSVSLLVKQ